MWCFWTKIFALRIGPSGTLFARTSIPEEYPSACTIYFSTFFQGSGTRWPLLALVKVTSMRQFRQSMSISPHHFRNSQAAGRNGHPSNTHAHSFQR